MFPPNGLQSQRRREQSSTVRIGSAQNNVVSVTTSKTSLGSARRQIMNPMKRERREKLRALRAQAKQITRDTGVAHDLHHRKPTSRNGTDDESNISIVPVKCHVAFHGIFSNLSPEAIAQVLSERWIDPDYELIARKKFKIT